MCLSWDQTKHENIYLLTMPYSSGSVKKWRIFQGISLFGQDIEDGFRINKTTVN